MLHWCIILSAFLANSAILLSHHNPSVNLISPTVCKVVNERPSVRLEKDTLTDTSLSCKESAMI